MTGCERVGVQQVAAPQCRPWALSRQGLVDEITRYEGRAAVVACGMGMPPLCTVSACCAASASARCGASASASECASQTNLECVFVCACLCVCVSVCLPARVVADGGRIRKRLAVHDRLVPVARPPCALDLCLEATAHEETCMPLPLPAIMPLRLAVREGKLIRQVVARLIYWRDGGVAQEVRLMEGEETEGEIVAVRHFGAVLHLPTVRQSLPHHPCVSPPRRRASRLAARTPAHSPCCCDPECLHVRYQQSMEGSGV